MYFGWNLGLEKGGTLGMAIATVLIVIMYLTFTFSYCELACSIPKAGGGFDYASKALGKNVGFFAGMAQNIEFIFAPPAIALAIGAYVQLFVPAWPALYTAIVIYVLFTALNAYGIRTAALFELVVTLLAVGELLLFSGLTLPHVEWNNLSRNALPNGWAGIFPALPFAIWFFLGIEGVANVAEETLRPQRTILIGFGSAIATLVILCVLTFISSTGVNGWETIVYNGDGSTTDSPLPLALGKIVGNDHSMYHLLIAIGLFGLVASFHGLILASGRATYEFSRMGCAPSFLSNIHPRFHTPARALGINMSIGILALLTGRTAELITLSVFGALILYILSMIAVIRLRQTAPQMERPFKTPLYPAFPVIALFIASVAITAMFYYNPVQGAIFAGLMLVSFIIYKLTAGNQAQPTP
jgi:ethanolamine permease